MPTYVGKLERNQTLNATTYFAGPWQQFERTVIPIEGSRRLTADVVEHAVFVMSGTGSYQFNGARNPLTPGSAITVGYGAEVLICADQEAPIELFITSLAVSTS
ncbi:hypothetical protein [Mycolicibacterium mageritense]|uniref:hypothetical protein n=1 Tax=Mycolicibacterium mageritense TaxID=53462 RepID=UPI001E46AE3D|nr:hypothetical protein [Mycolicibacterium mageritense]GJJ21235.1 hypothetical protein MTY414_49080 [Mycolicibacterium mageritense]